jgi:hypothetical protein
VELRHVPPRGEGLNEGQELWPYQEPERRGKTRDGVICRGEITPRALHEWILLNRYGKRKGRHEQHSAEKIEVF